MRRLIRGLRNAPSRFGRFFLRFLEELGYRFTGLAFNMVLLFAIGSVMVFVRSTRPQGFDRISANTLNTAIRAELWGLGITHIFLCLIMVFQSPWTRSEASTFRFIGVKAMFWFSLAANYHPAPGIRLDTFISLLFVGFAIIDMDFNLIGRYIFGWEDRDEDSGKGHSGRDNTFIPGLRGTGQKRRDDAREEREW